eukprot:5722559-Ditylum_brightwellii.AAC.1
MSKTDKEFLMSKAATARQVTLSTAVFGRGTDIFCKDESVEKNRGVHVIQAFLSEEKGEEIQIQGRTARQGKRDRIGLVKGWKDGRAKKDLYRFLSAACQKHHDAVCEKIEANLADATERQ